MSNRAIRPAITALPRGEPFLFIIWYCQEASHLNPHAVSRSQACPERLTCQSAEGLRLMARSPALAALTAFAVVEPIGIEPMT